MALIVPAPLDTDQVTVGLATGMPNWSFPLTVNCWVALVNTLPDAGATAIVLSVGTTLTATVLDVLRPLVSATVTRNW